MFNIFLQKIGAGIVGVSMIVGGWFGYAPENKLGASTQASDVIALFTTSLASKITNTATSLTLTSAIDKDGTTLASSTYGFIIDEGTAKEEIILADCTGTTCTNLTRGLSVRTGTTTVSALRFEHRRGAEIKITDAPALIFATNVFSGKQNIENKLKYNSTISCDSALDICPKSYADSLAFGGIPAASETASGFVELATELETASSTSSGSIARLSIPASLATSTYNSATAGLKVVVTQNNGKINDNFISNLASTTIVTGTATTSTGATLTQLVPVGSITAYASTTAPTGWMLANGASVTVAMYPNLHAVIGYSYGGSGANFTLPNIQGRNILMASTTANVGQTGGESNHTLTVAELAAHTHPPLSPVTSFAGAKTGGTTFTGGSADYGLAATTGSTGSDAPHNVLDPYIILQYIIKY